jgi:hypothetical protein
MFAQIIRVLEPSSTIKEVDVDNEKSSAQHSRVKHYSGRHKTMVDRYDMTKD